MKPPPAGVVAHTETGVKVHDSGLMFWPIPKNAHTTMDNWLRTCGFASRFGTPETDGYRHFVIVRHPLGRYIAALAQTWRAGGWDCSWPELIAKVERHNRQELFTVADDLHFRPQHHTVDRIPSPAVFAIDQLDAMREWLAARGVVSTSPLDVRNPTDPHMVRHALDGLDPDPILIHYQTDLSIWKETR